MVSGQSMRTVYELVSILGVSVYLAAVACLLLVTGRIRVSPHKFARVLAHTLIAPFRPPFSGELAEVAHEKGHCYVASLRRKLISDLDGRSRLMLFEDGHELPHPHSDHDEIRDLGAGRYSHWGEAVFFSSSDNTNPSTNGRRYSVREV